MKIEFITSNSDEVRVTTEDKTFIFNRRGVETATGVGLTMDEFVPLREPLAKQESLTQSQRAIVNLTLRDHKLKEI